MNIIYNSAVNFQIGYKIIIIIQNPTKQKGVDNRMNECPNHFTSKDEYDFYMESSNTEVYDKNCQSCSNMVFDYSQGIITCKKFNPHL